MTFQFSLILGLDNIVLNNYWRKYYTYLKIGWDDASIRDYLSKYMMQIASFNTRTVSFSASSRRNKFYEIYNRPDMLEQDVAWEGSVEAIKKISQKFKIYIVSSRSNEMRRKTFIFERNYRQMVASLDGCSSRISSLDYHRRIYDVGLEDRVLSS